MRVVFLKVTYRQGRVHHRAGQDDAGYFLKVTYRQEQSRISMKILIVDDERAIRNSLKEILGDEGYDVDVAEDGATALAMVDKERYNVIFCDHHQERLGEGHNNLREQEP